jgi:hypothetical protein
MRLIFFERQASTAAASTAARAHVSPSLKGDSNTCP